MVFVEGTAWAVQERQITIYRLYDYVSRKDELVAVKPLTAEQLKAIKEAVRLLPKNSLGFSHFGVHGTDAPILRLSFRTDGSLDDRGIEVYGFQPEWLDHLIAVVSSISQPEAPITFAKVVSDWRHKFRDELSDVRTVSLRELYGHEKPWWQFWK